MSGFRDISAADNVGSLRGNRSFLSSFRFNDRRSGHLDARTVQRSVVGAVSDGVPDVIV